MFSLIERGRYETPEYCIYFKNAYGKIISPLHDVPLFANNTKDIFNMIVRAPRWSNMKMNIHPGEFLNPIKHHLHNGKPNYIRNTSQYHGYLWNCGFLPQTRSHKRDPIECFDIGQRIPRTGEVIEVKILGAVPLIIIDDGARRIEWKAFAINIRDSDAEKFQDIHELQRQLPNVFKITVDWLTRNSIYDGNVNIHLGNGGKAKGKASAKKVIMESHGLWKAFITGNAGQASESAKLTTTITNSPYFINYNLVKEFLKK